MKRTTTSFKYEYGVCIWQDFNRQSNRCLRTPYVHVVSWRPGCPDGSLRDNDHERKCEEHGRERRQARGGRKTRERIGGQSDANEGRRPTRGSGVRSEPLSTQRRCDSEQAIHIERTWSDGPGESVVSLDAWLDGTVLASPEPRDALSSRLDGARRAV